MDSEAPLDPELARYLNKDYWQKRSQEQNEAVVFIVQFYVLRLIQMLVLHQNRFRSTEKSF